MCAFPEKLKKKTAFLIKHLIYCQAQTWTNNEILLYFGWLSDWHGTIQSMHNLIFTYSRLNCPMLLQMFCWSGFHVALNLVWWQNYKHWMDRWTWYDWHIINRLTLYDWQLMRTWVCYEYNLGMYVYRYVIY